MIIVQFFDGERFMERNDHETFVTADEGVMCISNGFEFISVSTRADGLITFRAPRDSLAPVVRAEAGKTPLDWAALLGTYHYIVNGQTDIFILADCQRFLRALADAF